MPNNIVCPICGSEMVDRIAGRGANAGKHFWGCKRYPDCKGTLDMNEPQVQNISSSYTEDIFQPSILNFRQVKFAARERKSGYDVQFRQGIAVPETTLSEINMSDNLRNEYIRYGHWRIDFTRPQCFPHKNVCLIAGHIRKLQKRGRITLVSPWLEESIKKMCHMQNIESKTTPYRLIQMINAPHRFDSFLDGTGVEEKFYWEFLRSSFGDGFHRFVAPQVFHSGIIEQGEISSNTRIDFVLTIGERCLAVEVDDPATHDGHKVRDNNRDEILNNVHIKTVRIPVSQISNGFGRELEETMSLFRDYAKQLSGESPSKADVIPFAIKLAYQIQSALIEALDIGLLHEKTVKVLINLNTAFIDKKAAKLLLTAICKDFQEQVRMMCALNGMECFHFIDSLEILPYENDVDGLLITFQTDQISAMPQMIIQDMVLPLLFIDPCPAVFTSGSFVPSEEILTYYLQFLFRKRQLLEGQLETLTRILQNKDTIVLLPTGAGKSIAFQLAALLLPGVSLVVDPIIALIQDQMDNLQRIGIDRVGGISSDIKNRDDKQRILKLFGQGEYLLFYIAPERFQMSDFREAVKEASITRPIPLVAIDEAHCVSEWGHDFRTAYLNLGRTVREYCLNRLKPACIAALTGTASSAVLHDIQRELQITTYDAIITPKTFDRKELYFDIISAKSSEKFNALAAILHSKLPGFFRTSAESFYQPRGEKTNCGIVFCPHKDGEYGIVKVAQKISGRTGIRTEMYSGSAPKSINDDQWRDIKHKNARSFKNNEFSILAATNAFGMGIDKPNIRFTIHYGLPQSPEAFYQEAGRAGRDRNASYCFLILSNDHKEQNQELLDFRTKSEDIKKAINDKPRNEADDIDRLLYFHTNSFGGESAETKHISTICNRLGNKPVEKKVTLPYGWNGNEDKEQLEKTIHRFVILGVINDYTINYGSREIVAECSSSDKESIIDHYATYVRGYNRGRVQREVDKLRQFQQLPYNEFVANAFKVLLTFIYDTIEKGRRRALSEMLAIASQASLSNNGNEVVRKRVVEYFETHHSEEIDEILSSSSGGFETVRNILVGVETQDGQLVGEVRSPMEASELRGEVSRNLESTPDHPGLLFLRALTEVMSSDSDMDTIIQNIRAAYISAIERYNVNESELFEMLSFSANMIAEKRPDYYSKTIIDMLNLVSNDDFAFFLISKADSDEMLLEPMTYLLQNHMYEVRNALNIK